MRPAAARSETDASRLLRIVLLLGTGAIFWNLWGGALKSWDETLTAERAREILVFRDWLTMHWNYEPDFIKPPLYYWLTALLYHLVGVNDFAARFWSAVFGVLGLYAVSRLGTVLFSARLGIVAAALFLTVTSYLNYARAAMLDTGLFSFGILALCAFLAQTPLRGWLFLGIGFMLKGPWVFFMFSRCHSGGGRTGAGNNSRTLRSIGVLGSFSRLFSPGTSLNIWSTDKRFSIPM